jgi:hypothetical protein
LNILEIGLDMASRLGMEPVESILEEYRNFDAECRLDLFLGDRDLRDRFTAIETGEET